MSEKDGQGTFQWTNVRHQYYGTIAANLILLSHGTVIGWISPAIPKLTSENSPLSSGPLTSEQVSWISSINCIGSLVGSLSFGFFASFMGCKRAMLLLTVPSVIFWLLIYFGHNYHYILLARFIGGCAVGGMQTIIILYVSEIANDDIRGRLGGFSHFLRNIGILVGYSLGATLDYKSIPCICVFMPIIYAIIFAFLPNTPRFYLRKGEIKKAEDSLKYYKGYTGKSVEENVALHEELQRLNLIVNEQKAGEKLKMSDICNRTVMKGLGIGFSLPILAQLTGNFTMVTYAVPILKMSGTSFNPYASSIVFAVMLIIGSSATTYFADILGRKRLIFISLIGSAIGQLVASLYHYLYMNGYNMSAFAWVPVVSLSFVIFISAAGILPLQVICTIEYLPSKIRTLGMSLISCAISMCAFTAVKLFPILLELLNLHGCMLIYGSCCIAGSFYVIFVLNETSKKSLDEIGKTEKITIDCVRSKRINTT